MNNPAPDPAAVFAAASSLWQACHNAAAREPSLNLSDAYGGMDELMREAMRIASLFEEWACRHIVFEKLVQVWPYLMEDAFGAACLDIFQSSALAEFACDDCLRIALRLGLPIRYGDSLGAPLSLMADHPTPGAGFTKFAIRTMRMALADGDITVFSASDDPFDAGFGRPFLALYGVGANGLSEHIVNRETYGEMLELIRKMVPGIGFPDVPILNCASASFGDGPV